MGIINVSDNGGINESLRLSLLADFSRSCGLISSKDLDKISPDSDPFKTNATVDYKLYNSESPNIFREAISNLIYDNFFKLLLSSPDFGKTMSLVLFDFGKNNISAQDLRMIILDNVEEDVTDLIRRMQNGEQLTAAEISNSINNSLIKNKDKIKDEANKISKSTKNSQDGLSNYTPFSNLAITQRYKGIKWQPIKGGNISPKVLKRLANLSKNVKKQLEKSRGALKTAKSLVSLLKSLESVYSNGYVGIIKSLSKIVFSYVRDIGNSGVYVLNMIEPYTTIERFMPEVDYQNLKKYPNLTPDKIERMRLFERIDRNNVASSYDYLNSDLIKANPLISKFSPTEIDEYKSKDVDDLTKWLNSIYKPTTYASFINVIAQSFLDEGDLPSASMLNDYNSSFSFAKEFNISSGTVKRQPNALAQRLGFDEGLSWIRPGRPIFGNGSNSVVIVVAFSMPNLINLATSTFASLQSFIIFLNYLVKGKVGPEFKTWMNENTIFYKRFLRALGKIPRGSLNDFYSDQPYYDNSGKVMIPSRNAEDPDFYGFAVKSVLPGFFEYMDLLEGKFNSIVKKTKSTLASELDRMLKTIEDVINDLEDFIDLIDTVIGFFDLLSTSGLYTLKITSNGGNQDIVEKLYAAEGFPGVKEGDKLRLIGGMVYCYGTPNLKPNQIDFQGIIKQKMTLIDYEAALTKYESGGKYSDDDPGSLQDYMNSSGAIDIDYNSALDKIFKKLF